MPKETSATEYRKKNNTELLADLKKLREELQTIRFTKVTGTAVSKLSKIKGLRKQIARILAIIRENKKQETLQKRKYCYSVSVLIQEAHCHLIIPDDW